MVVERFRAGRASEVYERLEREGRLAPEDVSYEGSWVSADLGRCFQLMACDDVAVLQEWVASWEDLVEFEVVPVAPSAATAEALTALSE